MEVQFLDVGQGTCQLILLGDGRAIVVDAGPQADRVLLRALEHHSIDRIERLVLSHSHKDHTAAASRVLTTYAERIGEIWFVDDSRLRESTFFSRLQQMAEEKRIDRGRQLRRIECDDTPRELFADDDRGLRLVIFSPSFSENLDAITHNDPNETSAVIALDVEGSRIVFSGDATIQQWRTIHSARSKPLECDVLAVPHHGGDIGSTDETDYRWLYTEAIDAKHAVISVGTRQGYRYGHPKQVVVNELRGSGTTVLCTQITEACCPNLETARRGVMSPLHPVRQSLTTKSLNKRQKSERVPCAGTVQATLDQANGWVIKNLGPYQQAIDGLASDASATPLCRGCNA